MHQNEEKNGEGKISTIFVMPSFVLLLLCLPLIGCLKSKPVMTYQPVQEKYFAPRKQPAFLSQKSSATLIEEGFVKIGYMNLNILEKTCSHFDVGGQDIKGRCIAFPHADPISLLLEKGQSVGGNLIVIEFTKPYIEIMNMMARDGYYRKEFSSITAAVWRKNG